MSNVSEITFEQVLIVCDSWDQVKRIPCYEPVFGRLLFEKLFELEPRAYGPLGFSPDEKVVDNANFDVLAHIMTDMVDLSVGSLGPHLELLADDLKDLGRRHLNYNVEPEYFASMGVALVYSLKQVLPDFSEKEEEAWVKIFCYMIAHMSQGLREAQKDHKQSTTGRLY